MAEWGVPRDVLTNLKELLGPRLRDKDISVSRAALNATFAEYDSWSDYTDHHEKTTSRNAWILLVVIVACFSLGLSVYGLNTPSCSVCSSPGAPAVAPA